MAEKLLKSIMELLREIVWLQNSKVGKVFPKPINSCLFSWKIEWNYQGIKSSTIIIFFSVFWRGLQWLLCYTRNCWVWIFVLIYGYCSNRSFVDHAISTYKDDDGSKQDGWQYGWYSTPFRHFFLEVLPTRCEVWDMLNEAIWKNSWLGHLFWRLHQWRKT